MQTAMTAAERGVRDRAETEPIPSSEQVQDGALVSRKRSASAALNHSPAKVLKSTERCELATAGGAGTMATTAEGNDQISQDAEDYKTKFEQLRARANSAFQAIKKAKAELTEERDELRGQKAELEVEIDELKQMLRNNKGTESSKHMAKRIEEEVKKKYDKRFSDQKKKHEQDLTSQLASKHKALQKKVEDLKEKKEIAEQEAKDAKTEFSQKEKDLKKSYAEFKKDVKLEQQAEIRKYKPENIAEIKEKKETIKTYQNRIETLEKEIEKRDAEKAKFKEQCEKVEAFKKKAHAIIRDLQDGSKKDKDFISSIGAEYGAKRAELEAKLVEEGKKWAKQKECCDELKQKLVEQQRASSRYREANEYMSKKIERLKTEVKRLREGSGGVGTGDRGVEVGTQTVEVDVRGWKAVGRVDGREGQGNEMEVVKAKAVAVGDVEDVNNDAASPNQPGGTPTQDTRAVPEIPRPAERADTPISLGAGNEDDVPTTGKEADKASVPETAMVSGKTDSPPTASFRDLAQHEASAVGSEDEAMNIEKATRDQGIGTALPSDATNDMAFGNAARDMREDGVRDDVAGTGEDGGNLSFFDKGGAGDVATEGGDVEMMGSGEGDAAVSEVSGLFDGEGRVD